jgi:hypothetical protein
MQNILWTDDILQWNSQQWSPIFHSFTNGVNDNRIFDNILGAIDKRDSSEITAVRFTSHFIKK